MTNEKIEVLADPWLVPAALADFECEHGHLPGECEECDGKVNGERPEHPA